MKEQNKKKCLTHARTWNDDPINVRKREILMAHDGFAHTHKLRICMFPTTREKKAERERECEYTHRVATGKIWKKNEKIANVINYFYQHVFVTLRSHI